MTKISIIILALFVLNTFCQYPNPFSVPDLQTSCNVVDVSKLGAPLPAYQTVYSGYMRVSSTTKSALAFVFYGSQKAKSKDELANYPTIIWLNGGPGTSSHMGNFMEHGPILIMTDGTKVLNKFSWNTEYNVLFVDNPISVGYSYAESKAEVPINQDQVADQFLYALNEFFNTSAGCLKSQKIEKLADQAWFLSGESFAGKYIPAIGERILYQTKVKMNFKGISLGDPYTDLEAIVQAIPSYAYQMYLLDYDQLRQCEFVAYTTLSQMKSGDYNNAIASYYQLIALIQSFTGNVNSFNIFVFGTYKYREPSIQAYLDSLETKKMFGFNPEVPYIMKNMDVKNGFASDMVHLDCVARVENILKKGGQVLVYSGQNDIAVPPPGTARWVNNLNHAYGAEFRELKYELWVLNERVVGYKKKAGNLELRQVNFSGHLVPMDTPDVALDLIMSFIESHK